MSQQNNTPAKVIACPAGLRRVEEQTAVWIQSPKTGRRVEILAPWWRDLPARLAARITHAAARGVRLVGFTREELAAVVAVAERIGDRRQPVPLHGGWHRRPASRAFGRYGRRGA